MNPNSASTSHAPNSKRRGRDGEQRRKQERKSFAKARGRGHQGRRKQTLEG